MAANITLYAARGAAVPIARVKQATTLATALRPQESSPLSIPHTLDRDGIPQLWANRAAELYPELPGANRFINLEANPLTAFDAARSMEWTMWAGSDRAAFQNGAGDTIAVQAGDHDYAFSVLQQHVSHATFFQVGDGLPEAMRFSWSMGLTDTTAIMRAMQIEHFGPWQSAVSFLNSLNDYGSRSPADSLKAIVAGHDRDWQAIQTRRDNRTTEDMMEVIDMDRGPFHKLAMRSGPDHARVNFSITPMSDKAYRLSLHYTSPQALESGIATDTLPLLIERLHARFDDSENVNEANWNHWM